MSNPAQKLSPKRKEEIVEYHWNRIIPVVFLLAGALYALIVWVMPGQDTVAPMIEVSQQPAASADTVDAATPADAPAQNVAKATQTAEDEPLYTEADLGQPLFYDQETGLAYEDHRPRYTEEDLGEPLFAERSLPEQKDGDKGLATQSLEASPAAEPIVADADSNFDELPAPAAGPAKTLAKAESPTTVLAKGLVIHDDRLSRAQLASGIQAYEPVDELPSELALDDAEVIRVYFFSELTGLEGQTVYHQWFQGDKRVARIAIQPHRSPMRASSAKFINRQMTGPWTVKVVTADGTVLGEHQFNVSLTTPNKAG